MDPRRRRRAPDHPTRRTALTPAHNPQTERPAPRHRVRAFSIAWDRESVREQDRATLLASNRIELRYAPHCHKPDHSADRPPVHARFSLQPVAAQHNLSVPDATLEAMRIRTIDGPPLPAEIAEMTARALALTQLHHATGRSTSANNAAMDRPDALTSAVE